MKRFVYKRKVFIWQKKQEHEFLYASIIVLRLQLDRYQVKHKLVAQLIILLNVKYIRHLPPYECITLWTVAFWYSLHYVILS